MRRALKLAARSLGATALRGLALSALVWALTVILPATGLGSASAAGRDPTWSSPVLVDRAAPPQVANYLTAVTCPSMGLCMAVAAKSAGPQSSRRPERRTFPVALPGFEPGRDGL